MQSLTKKQIQQIYNKKQIYNKYFFEHDIPNIAWNILIQKKNNNTCYICEIQIELSSLYFSLLNLDPYCQATSQ